VRVDLSVQRGPYLSAAHGDLIPEAIRRS
jgi:hypothetical protein